MMSIYRAAGRPLVVYFYKLYFCLLGLFAGCAPAPLPKHA